MEMTATLLYHINTTNVSDQKYYEYINEHDEMRRFLKTMMLTIFSLAFVLGVFGNGVVIWVIGFKMKKTVNTVWLLNLAVADFLFTALLVLRAKSPAFDDHWPFGKFMCKLNNASTCLHMFASVYFLVVISVDRYVSVVWPVCAQNQRSLRKASCVSLGVWVLALIFSAPYFVFGDTVSAYFDDNNIIICFNNFAFSDDHETPSAYQLIMFRYQAMIIAHLILGFVVPFTVIVSCYGVIIHRLRRNHTLISQSSRAFITIAAVVTIYIMCWAPYHIIALLELVHYMTNYTSKTLDYVTTVGIPLSTSLAFLNSCLNPLLYMFMGQDFKDRVRKSILHVLEAAFQEEVSGFHIDTNTADRQSKERSILDTEV